jgi:hypothetical protein
MSPSQSQWVNAGTSATYTVTVTNMDNTGCAASTFDVAASVPAGWSVTYGGSPISVAPGASGSGTVSVISSTSAASGFYTIPVAATDTVDTTHTGATSATYVIASSLDVGVSTDRATYTTSQWVMVTTNVQANGSPVAGASVTVTITRANGSKTSLSATTGANGTAVVKYRIKKQDAKGTYQATSNVTQSGAVNGTASTSFVLQ